MFSHENDVMSFCRFVFWMSILVTLALPCSPVAFAGSGYSELHYRKNNIGGYWADRAGNYTDAERQWKEALSETSKLGKPDARHAISLRNVALVLDEQDKSVEAEPYFKQSVVVYEKLYGLENYEVGATLLYLGQCYDKLGRPAEAVPCFQRAQAIFEKTKGVNARMTADALRGLGMSYYQLGRYAEAQTSSQRAASIYEKVCGPKDIERSLILTDLANLNFSSGKYAEAEPLYQKALAIMESVKQPNYYSLAVSADNLAGLYRAQNRLSEAEPCYQKGLRYWESAKGLESLPVANELEQLGELYRAQKRYAEAEGAYKRLLAIKEKLQGKDDPAVAKTLNYLAGLYDVQGKKNDADSLYKRSETIEGQTDKVNRLGSAIKDKWALLIGVGQYTDKAINPLKYADKDARDFGYFLIKECGFAPDHVKLLINQDATRKNIMEVMGDKWLPLAAGSDDLVIVFISSHGSPADEVGGTNYIVAHDTELNNLWSTGIPMQDLTRMIKGRVHCDRVVLLIDACHSGATQLEGKALLRESEKGAEDLAQGTGQLVITSSRDNQISWESKRYPNGVFTHYLIEGLRQHGKDTRLGDAVDFMKENVQAEVARDRNGTAQIPVLKSKWEGRDLILAVTPSKPRLGPSEEPQALAFLSDDTGGGKGGGGASSPAERTFPGAASSKDDSLRVGASSTRSSGQTESEGAGAAGASSKVFSSGNLVRERIPAESSSTAHEGDGSQALWQTYMDSAREACRQGKYDRAEQVLRVALREAERMVGQDGQARLATSLNSLADVYSIRGRFVEAEPLYSRALAVFQRSLGSSHEKVADCLSSYATLLRKTGRAAEADKMDARARMIRLAH